MKKLTKSTITGIATELTVPPRSKAELCELIAPMLGGITGLQDLLHERDAHAGIDLGALTQAGAIQKDAD